MLEIGGRFSTDVVVIDKGNIITLVLGFHLEAVEQGRKKFVRQASAAFIYEENSEIVGPVRFQGTCGGIGEISEFICRCADLVPGFFSNVRLVVESLADCGNGYAADISDVLQRYPRPA